ncbi:hypothetical protein NC652_040738 [Populus alba x Populus x berolinensis]|nr:hypothetical protein NC652_040738 [Populus alba x Populus x berolinensis]
MDAKVLFQLMKVAKHQQERIVVNASCSSQVLPTVAWTADSSFTNPVQNCHKKFSTAKTSSVTGLISIDLCQVSVLSIESLYARSAKVFAKTPTSAWSETFVIFIHNEFYYHLMLSMNTISIRPSMSIHMLRMTLRRVVCGKERDTELFANSML